MDFGVYIEDDKEQFSSLVLKMTMIKAKKTLNGSKMAFFANTSKPNYKWQQKVRLFEVPYKFYKFFLINSHALLTLKHLTFSKLSWYVNELNWHFLAHIIFSHNACIYHKLKRWWKTLVIHLITLFCWVIWN